MWRIFIILFVILFLLLILYYTHDTGNSGHIGDNSMFNSNLIESYDKYSRSCGYYNNSDECLSNHNCAWKSIKSHEEEYDYCTIQNKILDGELS